MPKQDFKTSLRYSGSTHSRLDVAVAASVPCIVEKTCVVDSVMARECVVIFSLFISKKRLPLAMDCAKNTTDKLRRRALLGFFTAIYVTSDCYFCSYQGSMYSITNDDNSRCENNGVVNLRVDRKPVMMTY